MNHQPKRTLLLAPAGEGGGQFAQHRGALLQSTKKLKLAERLFGMTAARKDLTQALGLNRESGMADDRPVNPKIEALCCLHLARSYAREHEGARAEEYLKRWKAIGDEVEHRYVRDLAEEVEGEVKALEADFVIKASPDGDLNYKKDMRALQRFLIDRAKNGSSEKQKVAAELGITRQALYEWEKEIRKQGGRADGALPEGRSAGRAATRRTNSKKPGRLK